ncbi:hypothetical protein GCM10010345_42040 [Streptomyces canarius]|uniref:Uncharacterized protein n=1 Tax=Streptomyces canarius TaxID=285453 RepID=A0ABQ3CNZ6_9ACTN|nr:hypothetical protein GCM10010345_42040 [Streptomyces canarius]
MNAFTFTSHYDALIFSLRRGSPLTSTAHTWARRIISPQAPLFHVKRTPGRVVEPGTVAFCTDGDAARALSPATCTGAPLSWRPYATAPPSGWN